jgi:hypothetical protein
VGTNFVESRATPRSSTSIHQLKAKVEVEAGDPAATMAIYLPEVNRPLEQNATLTDYGLPSKLYALTLHKLVISEMLGVDPSRP